MQKYQLSKKYELKLCKTIDSPSTTEKQPNQAETYLLIDAAADEKIVINQAMYIFLNEYETPKNLKEVAAVLASAFDSTPTEVFPIAQQFLKDMKQSGVIVSSKTVERIEMIAPYPVGTLIDGYRIEENLSVSLPTEVYRATDVQKDQPVILKVLRMPTQIPAKKQEKWRANFRKEFTIQKILRGHPNICQLLDLQPDYAVLEWIEGITLRRRLVEGTPLDAQLLKTLLSQILDSYTFMHDNNILHGDVHTQNILVTNDSHIKVIDFDLAHKLTKKNPAPHVRGAMPEFVPPENVRFDAFSIVKGKANHRTEVYQLGIIAYWMTYGKLPFSGDVWQNIATDIVNKDVDFPTLDRNGSPVPPEMEAFLRKSLEKNPENRFKSAKEMKVVFELYPSFLAAHLI